MTIKDFFKSKATLAINCKTEKQAEKLLTAFDKAGYKWSTGDKYDAEDTTLWWGYGERTCYLNNNTFTGMDYCIEYNYRIIPFESINFGDKIEEKKEKPEKMKKYIIFYNLNDYMIEKAENAKELILKFAKYTGFDDPLLEKAVSGLTEKKDLVEMHNHFSCEQITAIYELGEKIYDEVDEE